MPAARNDRFVAPSKFFVADHFAPTITTKQPLKKRLKVFPLSVPDLGDQRTVRSHGLFLQSELHPVGSSARPLGKALIEASPFFVKRTKMFSGEAEIQARRKTLAVLQDEVRRVLDASRELVQLYIALSKNDPAGLQSSLERIRKAEEDTEQLRRMLTRELAEIGTMMINREDFLRTAYNVEEMSGYVAGIAFRLSQIKFAGIKKASIVDELRDLIDMSVESVQRLNEVVRALAINPIHAIDLSNSVQKLERQVDDKYRNLTNKIMNQVDSFKELILLKDIIQGIEDLVDNCLGATDSITILALGL
jgi:uncharacterized protein Yka (UPF0111/DUF47 family)